MSLILPSIITEPNISSYERRIEELTRELRLVRSCLEQTKRKASWLQLENDTLRQKFDSLKTKYNALCVIIQRLVR